jgi:photosystem II stability/assembly factor-like uncharacterized protein
MKSLSIYLLALFAFSANLRGQWEVVNEGYAFRLIDFVDKDVGWMVTEDTILKTIDGGETWVPDHWNLGEGYRGWPYIDVLDFVNDSVGWISMYTRPIDGYGGNGLFKTVDGGKSWAICSEGKYLELEYASEDMVIVSTSEAYTHLLKSTDGGNTWEDITRSEHDWGESISFIGPDTGISTRSDGSSSGTILNRTFDGGKSWHYTTLPGFESISEIGFIDKSNGYFVATRYSDQFEDRTHAICKTEDAFDTWTVVYETHYPVHSCHFFNKDTCIALLDDSFGCNILKSLDGGRTWVDPASIRIPVLQHGCEDVLYKIKFFNSSTGIIYSEGDNHYNPSILLKSLDRGNRWSMLNLSYPFYDLFFINTQKGFAVGGDFNIHCHFGHIFGTIDGGNSWNLIIGLIAVVNCEFVNDSIGYVANPWKGGIWDYGRYSTNLFQTTDGGESWNESIHTFNQFTGLKFINEHVGFAMNDSGIFMTNNLGETWSMLLSPDVSGLIAPWNFITTIEVSDENTYWAIAGNTSVIRFTGEGSWEIIELETEQDLFKIFFKDENTGWIASGAYSTLFKTEDGGETWFRIDNPYQFRDMLFIDSLKGWAVGIDSLDQGVILETTNGGEDWNVQVDSLSAPLNGLDYKDGNVWAVGEHGLILRMHDSTYVSVNERSDAPIRDNYPVQIYPNPANSILNIETEISGLYSIELLNLNGQLLMNEVVPETRHQLDLSHCQEGVYIIAIKTNNSLIFRKILKLQ